MPDTSTDCQSNLRKVSGERLVPAAVLSRRGGRYLRLLNRWRVAESAVYAVPDVSGMINKVLFVFRHWVPAWRAFYFSDVA
jgi:hypothetical protein